MSDKFFYRKEFSKIINSVPDEYNNKIICGDSLDVMSKMPDNCIDAIITSPPYNFGMDYDKTDDEQDWRLYFEELNKIWDECIRVLKYGGRLIINIQPLYSDYVPSHHVISHHLMERGLIWRAEILWEKNHYNCNYTAWGSWCSPSSPYLKYSWEFVEVFCKGDLKKSGDKELADISGDDFKKWVYGKWSIAPEKRMKDFGHPAMFPEELAKRIIQLFTYRKDVILDPFAGAGTTCVVAGRHDRNWIGIDISQDYCDTAIKRMRSNESPEELFGDLFEAG